MKMKRNCMMMLLLFMTSLKIDAATEWFDVTDIHIINPRFENNDVKTGWEGTAFSATNPFENAEHFNKNYDTYQTVTGLTPGKYRVSLSAFYRMGSASNDYSLYNGKNYSGSQNAKLYATTSSGEKNVAIVPASSAALEASLGGSASEVSSGEGWWSWWNTTYYIPNNMEAAHYWFEAGYYTNSLECEVGTDGTLTFGIRKTTKINQDWTCLDNWKLEFSGELENVQLSETDLTMFPHETRNLMASALPFNVAYTNVTWTSSNKQVATVDAKGQVIAIGTGTCYITVKSKKDGTKTAQCQVTVSKDADIAQSLVINEIMASNADVYLDPSFNYGCWVELYNPSDKGISLGGLYVTDDPNNLTKKRLIDNYDVLPAKGYALLNFDHHEVWKMVSYRQIDDKLDCDGGIIILSDGNKILVQQEYPKALSRISYARTTDGGPEWSWTGNPSPGTSNQLSGGFSTAQLDAPIVDKNAQVFEGTLQVCVNIPAGATLMYTTDGTAPTLTNGRVSETGLFSVKNTTCYRFRLFNDNALPSQVVTRTYIYKDRSFPFPIISVVTDDKNLNSREYGLFKEGPNGRKGRGKETDCNWNMAWDRPVSFEYINTNNECLVSQECDFSMCGGWSRAWTPHSFKLKANKTYDLNNFFKAQFFDKKPYLKNKTLQIRNGGNDSQTYGNYGGRIRDAILQQIVARSGMNIDYQEWQPVHVLINGKYYATLSMREPNNKHYAYANYGIDTDEMDQFEIDPDSGYVQMEGTQDAWKKLVELSKTATREDTYAEICQLLDIDEYINIMAAELYLGGTDWPHNNVKGFRDVNNGKFRFVLFDLDFAGQTSTPFENFFGKEKTQSEHSLYGYDYSLGKSIEGTRRSITNTFVTLFKNLLKNDQFRKRFIDTYCIFGGSVMQPKYVKAIANEMKDYMKKGIYSEDNFDPSISANYVINKFTLTYNNNIVDHMKKRSEMKISALTKQSVSIAASVDEAKIMVNGIELPYNEFEGYLFSPITVKAVAPAGYQFVRWTSGAEQSDIRSTETEYTLPTTGTQKLYAQFEEISSEDMLAEGITPVRVNEIGAANSMYVNDYFKKNDWVELYNTTDKDIDIAGMYVSDNVKKPEKYQVPTDDALLNTIIPAHGYKVLWCDKLDNIGTDIHTSFKLEADGGDVVITTSAYADTLHYDAHTGIQSFGRYPDGGNDTYVMNLPTLAKANQIGSYDTLYVAPEEVPEPDAIRTYTKEGGITIACVDGTINVKSEDAPIARVAIFSTSGMKMPVTPFMRAGNQFAAVNVATLPRGIYIAAATTASGDECRTKFVIK